MMKYIALFLMITTLPTANAAWRVGPRRQVQQVRQPVVRLVQRPAFAAPIQQSGGCRMVNGRMVCPNSGSVRGLLRVR